jgi:WD40 repeat protein
MLKWLLGISLIFLLKDYPLSQELKLGLPKGHVNGASILSANFSIDGKSIVTSSSINDTYLWSTETGTNYFQLFGHNSCAHESIFSNNGQFIATRSCDSKVIIWDKTTGGLIKQFQAKVPVNFIRFSPNSQLLLSTFNHRSYALFNTYDGKIIRKISVSPLWFLNPFNFYSGVSLSNELKSYYYHNNIFTADSKAIIVTKRNTITFFSTLNNKKLKKIKGYNKIEFNKDSTYYCISNKKQIQLRKNISDSIIIQVQNTNRSNCLFSEKGDLLITTIKDSCFIWSTKTGKLVKSFKDSNSFFLSAKFYGEDSKILTIGKNNNANLLDYNSLEFVKEFPNYLSQLKRKISSELGFFEAIFFSRKIMRWAGYELPWPSKINNNHRKYFVTINDSSFNLWNTKEAIICKTIYGSTSDRNFVINQENTKLISYSRDTNEIKLYNLEDTSSVLSLKPHFGEIRYSKSFLLQNRNYIMSSTGRDKVVIIDYETGKIKHELNQKNVKGISILNNHALIMSSNQFSIWRLDSISRLVFKQTKRKYRGSGIESNKFWISKGSITKSFRIRDDKLKIAGINLEFNFLRYIIWNYSHPFEFLRFIPFNSSFNIEEKNIRYTQDIVYSKTTMFRHRDVNYVDQSPDGNFLVTASYDKSAIIWKLNGVYFKTLNGHSLGLITAKFSNDSKYVFTSSLDLTIRMWEVVSGKCIKILTCSSPAVNIEFIQDNLLLSYEDGSIGIWDIQNSKELLRSYYFDGDPNKWVHIHPSGLFDASPEAMEMMYWIKGLEVIEFSQLKDRYWLPDLWKKVIADEPLPEVGDMQKLKLYPEVALESTSSEDIAINLKKRDGGYGAVKVLLNGKEIDRDVRGSNFDLNAEKQTINLNIKNHPYLVKGENELKVIASSENGVDSRGVVLSIINDTKETVDPNFYGIIIGIGDYANSSINLKYPVQDADATSKAITLAAKNLFQEKAHIFTLTSNSQHRPSKQKIKEIFDGISKKAKSDDIVFVYLAGHGISTSGEKGDFYFLTADAKSANSEAYQDEVIRQSTSISSIEFVEWIKNIPALKQVMILDACGSGKAVDNLVASREIEPSQLKAIDRMKDRTGMFIISGCAADAVSYESSQYGQGLLTYSILQAMKGAALKENKFVDVNTILSFARDEVPKLASGIGGIQTPQLLIPKSGSFDIGILEDSDKIAIPLAKPKVVFVRSNLVESNEDDDILNLSELLDEQLSHIASRGVDSKIVFFDTRMFPQSCKLTGGYNKIGDKLILNLKVRCGEKVTEHKIEAENKEDLVKRIIKIVELD